MVARQQHLDPRALESLQLLAYTAGALPHPAAQPASRTTLLREPTSRKGLPVVENAPPRSIVRSALTCAVCRVAAHELQHAVQLAARCGQGSEAASMLTASVEVLCDHLEARGLLGHTERTVKLTRPMCDGPVRTSRRKLSRVLPELLAEMRAQGAKVGNAGSRADLSRILCAAACNATLGHQPVGELHDWPAAAQLLLDHDGASPPVRSHQILPDPTCSHLIPLDLTCSHQIPPDPTPARPARLSCSAPCATALPSHMRSSRPS